MPAPPGAIGMIVMTLVSANTARMSPGESSVGADAHDPQGDDEHRGPGELAERPDDHRDQATAPDDLAQLVAERADRSPDIRGGGRGGRQRGAAGPR